MTIQKTIITIDQELTHTLNDYNTWFDLDHEVLSYIPQTGWSIEQILEHVTLTNYFLLILIRKGYRKAKELAAKINLYEEVLKYQYNLGLLEEIANQKSFKWVRPEHLEPKGEKSLSEIKQLLGMQISECKEILFEMSNGEGILYKTTMSVNNLGKIDVYQYIYFLCLHAKRHIAQMQRVRDEFRSFKDAE